jgi:endonuclease G
MPKQSNRSFVVAALIALLVIVALVVFVRLGVRRTGPPMSGPATVIAPTGGGQPAASRPAPVSPHVAPGNPSDATSDAGNRNNYLLVKPQYVLSYNNDAGGPNWVSWRLQSADIGNVERQNNFHPEQALPAGFKRVTPDDYTGSGFDRGHVCPSKDRSSAAADNSETFSMANMLPQTPDLNRQVWEGLESYCRTLVRQGNQLYIIAGGYGAAKTIGRTNKVNVPANCWKVVLVLPAGWSDLAQVDANARVIAVDIPNIAGIAQDDWQQYLTTAQAIEQKTGYHFFTELPPDVANALKVKQDSGRP